MGRLEELISGSGYLPRPDTRLGNGDNDAWQSRFGKISNPDEQLYY
jgi:hypothetical protein